MNINEFKSCLSAWSRDHSAVDFQKPLVMGVLNVTPDSFSDGGHYIHADEALKHALNMIDAGADILDIGGESSRPGAAPVPEATELSRILPVIELIRKHSSIVISVDTTKPIVMREAIAAGADVINDITALRDPSALSLIRDLNVPVCLMHMQGTPDMMQFQPHYENGVVANIHQFFSQKISNCLEAGILREHIMIDPGFGFGKTAQHNLMIMKQLASFKQLGVPFMLGFSRKNTLGTIVKSSKMNRLSAGIALSVWSALQGVFMLRTHDVFETQQSLDMLAAVMNASVL